MDRALTLFVRCWAILSLLVNVIAVLGFFLRAENFWAGWNRVTEIYNPLNIANMFMELVLVSPALGAMYWRKRLRQSQPMNGGADAPLN